MPAQQAAEAVVLSPPRPPAQQISTSYGKVAAWLTSSCTPPGSPLLVRLSSSLLWYVGLGGALQHKQQRVAMQAQRLQQQRQLGGAAAAAAAADTAAAAAGMGAAAPAAAARGPAHSSPPPSAGQMHQPSILQSLSSGPCSHPLTLQHIEQSMEFSTSSSSASPGTAPVQAIAKGLKSRSATYLGPAGAAALKVGDDVVALIASFPRTMRTIKWALQAAVDYKRLLSGMDAELNPEAYNLQLSRLHDYWAQRLTEVCRANGGVYVKAGQFAAAFGAVPPEYRKHLALLQDKAKPRPFPEVDRVLRLELGAGAEEVFAEFSAEATAAASLAQVHKARLTDGRQVAVKVQYPGLRGAANADLTTLSLLSAGAAALFPDFKLAWLYEELRLKLTEELDFHTELYNSQKLMSCLHPNSSSSSGSSNSIRSRGGGRGADCVTVPKAHVALCTSKILTMEWIDGVKVNDTQGLRAVRINPREVGRVVDDAFAEMTFVHGFIHADPHPGNLMVRPKGRRGILSWLARGSWQPFEVVLLDHGTYLNISERLRQQYCQLWCSLFVGDRSTAASVAIELGGQRAGQILPVLLTQRGRTKEEQKQMQRAAGVGSFGDITQLLATAPRDVVELLRIAAVVRNVTASLSCTLAERLRISGTWAFRGLPGYFSQQTQAQPDATEADRRFAQAGYRLNIQARLLLIRSYVALNSVLNRALLATLYVFGQPVAMY